MNYSALRRASIACFSQMLVLLLPGIFLSQSLSAQTTLSPLSSGSWYKVGIVQSGLHRLSYSDLQNLGVPVSSVDPTTLKIYGHGGAMHPALNSTPRPTVLEELAIEFNDGGNGTFDAGDYLQFYAEGPMVWRYDTALNRMAHQTHLYADTIWYFVTWGGNTGKRIPLQAAPGSPPTHTVSTFNDYQAVEDETRNLIKSGQRWLGDEFSVLNSYIYPFSFPNIVAGSAQLYADMQAYTDASASASTFDFSVAGVNVGQLSIANVGSGSYADRARPESFSTTFTAGSAALDVKVDFNPAAASAVGWTDYLEMHVTRNLVMSGSELYFRDYSSVGTGNIAQFDIAGTTAAHRVWDVTDHWNTTEATVAFAVNSSSFSAPADELRQYVVFDDTGWQTPVLGPSIPNQDLYAQGGAELFIITAPEFLVDAERLADHRRNVTGLTVNVATTEQIYNDFSSGTPDITALRDYLRYYYDLSSVQIRHVLLFGDASYDYKNRIAGNTNYVPTWQSDNSWSVLSSYASDDFFGLLDLNESDAPSDLVDVGIGRLPAETIAEARDMVDKLIAYDSPNSFGIWRMQTAAVADDGDGNIHLQHEEALTDDQQNYGCMATPHKMYLDAYWRGTNPDGSFSFPAVSRRLEQEVDSGFLYVSYNGHGGPPQWANEQVLDSATVADWNNPHRMPVILSVHGEMNRFDQPDRYMLGEEMITRGNGGAIATIAPTRVSFVAPEFAIRQEMNGRMFGTSYSQPLHLGSIIQTAKNGTASLGVNRRGTTLLGDPSMVVARPAEKVVITDLNGQSPGSYTDTVPLGGNLAITAEVQDHSGVLLSGFNGEVEMMLLREEQFFTLAQATNSIQAEFHDWSDTLFLGTGTVVNGVINETITIPAGASPFYGKSRLLLYTHNGVTDAGGCTEGFSVGDIMAGEDPVVDDPFEISVYPNPAAEEFSIALSGISPENLTLMITDVTGRLVQHEALKEQVTVFNASQWAPGLYQVVVQDDNGQNVKREKLIVR